MDFRAGRPVIVPDDLLIRRDFAGASLPRKDDVAVRQHRAIAELTFSGVRVRPRDLPVAHDVDGLTRCRTALPFATVQERMLSQALSGQWRYFLCRCRSRGRRT